MENKSFWTSSKGIAASLFVGVVIYMLLMEHRQHVFQYLPLLILLSCPFMHLFMHGGHKGHGDHDNHNEHASHQHDAVDEAYRKGVEEGRRSRD